MKRYLRVLLIPATFAVSGCTSEIDLEEARATLLQTDREWEATWIEASDLDLMVSFYADDAVLFYPDTPDLRGRGAIREFVAGILQIPGFSAGWEVSEVVVSDGGDLGYVMGRSWGKMPGAEGDLVTTYSRYVDVWERQPDGNWKCVLIVSNADPSGGPDQG